MEQFSVRHENYLIYYWSVWSVANAFTTAVDVLMETVEKFICATLEKRI